MTWSRESWIEQVSQLDRLWIVLIELTMPPEDSPNGNTGGFMNVVTWAQDGPHAVNKIRTYLLSFNWHVVGVQESTLVDDEGHYEEDMADMIDRAQNNEHAIILGTFHSYKVN